MSAPYQGMFAMRLITYCLFAVLCVSSASFAFSTPHNPMVADKLLDLSDMEISPHELAFTQVLSEICPQYLNTAQKQQFKDAYYKQLKVLMPNLDPTLVLQQINRQKDYKITLKGMRAWTLSYPKEENRALCIEFAETPVVY